MLGALKKTFERAKKSVPGERFLKLHERWRRQQSGFASTVGIVAAGVVLLVIGLLLGLVPGVPGIVLGIFGAALIAMPFRRAALWLDRCELSLRRAWQRCWKAVAPKVGLGGHRG